MNMKDIDKYFGNWNLDNKKPPHYTTQYYSYRDYSEMQKEAREHNAKRKDGGDANEIVNVIFNDPATIVFWGDGTKTVVKCDRRETFDPEKSLAMAITKKIFGNKGNYYNVFKKWVPKMEMPEAETQKAKDSITNQMPNFAFCLGEKKNEKALH